jgi:site-specific DNA-methyltransferase (cytosine-N4-specific)
MTNNTLTIFDDKININTDKYYTLALKELQITENPESHYLDKENSVSEWIKEWDFKKYKIDIYTHQIHRYPAMFIPQLIRKLIDEYSNEGDIVLDIFNGSGTTSVESFLTNRKSIGIELNPLAYKLSLVKTTKVNIDKLLDSYQILSKLYFSSEIDKPIEFESIDVWFNESSKIILSHLLKTIRNEKNKSIRDIFEISFSDIVRQVSICKHSGFKLHRDLKKIEILWNKEKVFDLFHKSFIKSLKGLIQLNSSNKLKYQPQIINGDSTEYNDDLKNKIDLIITSPPYGDSRTTVAYGQFSRLSSQWLNLISVNKKGHIQNIDNELLGGKTKDVDLDNSILTHSNTLKTSMITFQYLIDKSEGETKKRMIKRAKDVMSFYIDLDKTIKNGSKYLKNNKYFILITGSRIVKGIKLNTDLIISELGEKYGLLLDGILYRKSIPNKRMPHKVSATNIIGETTPTMNKESIILLRKGTL